MNTVVSDATIDPLLVGDLSSLIYSACTWGTNGQNIGEWRASQSYRNDRTTRVATGDRDTETRQWRRRAAGILIDLMSFKNWSHHIHSSESLSAHSWHCTGRVYSASHVSLTLVYTRARLSTLAAPGWHFLIVNLIEIKQKNGMSEPCFHPAGVGSISTLFLLLTSLS